jgi:hypothetical protein
MPGNIPFYEWSMKLWEGLEQAINCNVWSTSARRAMSIP